MGEVSAGITASGASPCVPSGVHARQAPPPLQQSFGTRHLTRQVCHKALPTAPSSYHLPSPLRVDPRRYLPPPPLRYDRAFSSCVADAVSPLPPLVPDPPPRLPAASSWGLL